MNLAHLITKHSTRVLFAAALVTVLAVPVVARLSLETNLVALLPSGSPAADAYRLFLERFGGFEKVFIMVLPEEGVPTEAAELSAAVEEIRSALEGHQEVRGVRVGIEAADELFLLRFVVRRAPLLVREEERELLAERLLPEAVERRVARLRAALRRPGGGAEISLHLHDPLGFRELLPALTGGVGGMPIDPLTGVFMAPSEKAALLIVTPARAEIDPAGGRALAAAIRTACDQMRAALGTHLTCSAVGGPLYAAQDEAALKEDLRTTVTGSLLGCLLLLMLALGGWRLPFTTLVVLATALLWTGAVFTLLEGRLDALSLGFAAVLVGLGVDYGIHGATRFRQERMAGASPGDALSDTFRHAGPAVLTSALTTAMAFGTLALSHFNPLRQLGLLVAVGILAILLATITVGAACLLRMPVPGVAPQSRTTPERRGTFLWQGLGWLAATVPRGARRKCGVVLLGTVVVSVLAGIGVGRLDLDADLRRLRPDDHPAFAAEALLEGHFNLGSDTSTLLIPGADLDEVLARSAAAAQVLRNAEPRLVVTSPADWLLAAEDRASRLQFLQRLPWMRAADDLERSLRAAGLAPQAFAPGIEALRAWAEGRDPGAPAVSDWPQPFAELLRLEPPGAVAAVRLRRSAETWTEGMPPELEDSVQAAAPGSSMASAVALGSELRAVAGGDLLRLGGIGLMLVAAVVLLSFRGRPGPALLALVPVSLGTLWTFGLAGFWGLPLDLFGLAVLPILLGIGIDDGLHALHGSRRQLPTSDGMARGVVDSVEGAGRAMALTTLTTVVGFLSLGVSRIPALRAGGLLIALGVLCCLAATFVVLPALEAFFEKKNS